MTDGPRSSVTFDGRPPIITLPSVIEEKEIDDDGLIQTGDDDEESGPLLRRERLYSDPPISNCRLIGYGVGGMPGTAMGQIISVYFTLYLLQIVGIAPAYLTLIFLIARLLNAFSDPLIGYLISRTKETRLGRLKPWMLVSAPLAAIFYVLLWYIPPIESQAWLTCYYTVVYWLYAFLQTCYWVPYGSSVLAMSNSQRQRDSVISVRTACELTGSIVGLAVHAVWLILAGIYGMSPTAAYRGSSLTMIVIYMVLAGTAFLSINERYSLNRHGSTGLGLHRVLSEYWKLLTFKPFALYACLAMCLYVGYAVVTNNYALYFQYVFWQPQIFPLFIVVLFACSALSVPIWKVVLVKVGKKTLLTAAIGGTMVIFWTHFFLRYNAVLAFVLAAVIGLIVGALKLTPATMMPDVITAFSLRHGHGKEPMFYSLISFLDATAMAICSSLASAVLGLAGYDKRLPPESQPPAVAVSLRTIVGGFPLVLFCAALIILWEYPITENYRSLISHRIKESMSSLHNAFGQAAAGGLRPDKQQQQQQRKTGYGAADARIARIKIADLAVTTVQSGVS